MNPGAAEGPLPNVVEPPVAFDASPQARAEDVQPIFAPAVAVPARNEEHRLPALLAALSRQSWIARAGRPLPVVVVLNNCTDGSRAVVERAAGTLPGLALEGVEIELAPAEAHVGSARRLALERALERCDGPNGILLTTDADAVPDVDWVAANLAAIARGADCVGGLLQGDPDEEARLGPGFAARAEAIATYAALCDRYAALVDPLAHDPWPRHHNHTGGSLAVRAQTYRAVGGLPALPRREDLAFVDRVCAAGGRLVHPLDVRVTVSARLSGRAEGGMADCLKDWVRAEAEGAPILVRDPHAWGGFVRRRRAIRGLVRLPAGERIALAAMLGLPAISYRDEDPEIHAAALVAAHAPEEVDPPATMPVAPATAILRDMIRREEGAHRAA